MSRILSFVYYTTHTTAPHLVPIFLLRNEMLKGNGGTTCDVVEERGKDSFHGGSVGRGNDIGEWCSSRFFLSKGTQLGCEEKMNFGG